MVPRNQQIVLGHNDVQENNILALLEDSRKIGLIDFEYGGWNPMAYDLANYLNECTIDNAHPKGVGVKLYLENFPTEEERHHFLSVYLKRYFDEIVSQQ